MSIAQAAQAAVAVFPATTVSTSLGPLPLRVVMVAIAGAESGWNPVADGDCGLGGPACGTCPGAYGGATSWGLWQIHNAHAAYLTAQTGSTDPCVWRQWLEVPRHNAFAAYHVYQSQGLAAWSTYRNGAWEPHRNAAAQAVARAEGAAAGTSPGPAGSTQTAVVVPAPAPASSIAALGAALLLMGGLTIAVVEEWTPLRQAGRRVRAWLSMKA